MMECALNFRGMQDEYEYAYLIEVEENCELIPSTRSDGQIF
jgi:hypothetical protein